jgi:hypothetical protein
MKKGGDGVLPDGVPSRGVVSDTPTVYTVGACGS